MIHIVIVFNILHSILAFLGNRVSFKYICVWTGVCTCERLCVETLARYTQYRFVSCVYSSCHCVSLSSYLFVFFFIPPFSFLASFFLNFLSMCWRCCSLLSQCPAHLCDIAAGSVQSDQLLVKGVNETLVAQRVVPALITLSSDPEM